MVTILGRNKWDALPESGEIEVKMLIKDAEKLLPIVDLIGRMMKPVKNDLVGNIRKIQESHEKLGPNVFYLRELLELELSTGSHKKDPSACVGILWLTRGLTYFYRLFELVLEEKDNPNDSCSNAVSRAYNETLREHHNFFMKGVFNLVSRTTPKMSTLRLSFMENDPSKEEALNEELEAFLHRMKPIIDALLLLIENLKIK